MGHIIIRISRHIKTTPIAMEEFLSNEMAKDKMLGAKILN